MTLLFPDDLVHFMDEWIGRGYASREAVVREAFRLLAQRDTLRMELDKAAQQFDNGEFLEYDETGLEARFRELSDRVDVHSQRKSQA